MGSVGTYQKVRWTAHGKLASRKLYRTGRIQRYARGNRIHRPQAHTIGMLQTARFPDNWAEELGIPEPTQEDIDHWREVFRTQIEAMGESKKEKTDNQICKWLKDPESDSAKYKMWDKA